MNTSRNRPPLRQAMATSAGVHVLGLAALLILAPRSAPTMVEVTTVSPLEQSDLRADSGRALVAPAAAPPSMELVTGPAPRPRRVRSPMQGPGQNPALAAGGALASGTAGDRDERPRTEAPARAQLASVGIYAGEVQPEEAGSTGAAAAEPSPPALTAFLGELAKEVRTQWHPSQVFFPARSGENPGGSGDDARALLADAAVDARATTLRVELRADGSLAQIEVAESSGHAALDAEAVAAFERAQPFAPPAPGLLDDSGTLSFHFNLRLDLSAAAYLARLGRQLSASWAPSPAVRRFEGFDRMTVVRARLGADGTVTEAAVATPSGLDLLDASALAALRPGTRLPAPPGGLRRPGHADLRFTFLHRARDACEVMVARERGPAALAGNER
jgi:TonB family protein